MSGLGWVGVKLQWGLTLLWYTDTDSWLLCERSWVRFLFGAYFIGQGVWPSWRRCSKWVPFNKGIILTLWKNAFTAPPPLHFQCFILFLSTATYNFSYHFSPVWNVRSLNKGFIIWFPTDFLQIWIDFHLPILIGIYFQMIHTGLKCLNTFCYDDSLCNHFTKSLIEGEGKKITH